MKAKKYSPWKIAVGLLLLIFSPKHFVEPNTPQNVGYDLVGLIWWAAIAWLLWTGFGLGHSKESE